MIGVALLFSGGVLLVNALVLLGKADGPSATVFNLLGGVLNVAIAFWVGFHDEDGFSASKVLLFGFTYLWLAYNSILHITDGRAFGWYCAFVAAFGIPTAILTLDDGNRWFGGFWFLWAGLWGLFFVMFGLQKKGLELVAGIYTLVVAASCAVPGYLMVADRWDGLG